MEKKILKNGQLLTELLAFKVCQQRLSLPGLEGSGGHSATGVHTEPAVREPAVTSWVIRGGHSVPAGPGRYCKRFDRKCGQWRGLQTGCVCESIFAELGVNCDFLFCFGLSLEVPLSKVVKV